MTRRLAPLTTFHLTENDLVKLYITGNTLLIDNVSGSVDVYIDNELIGPVEDGLKIGDPSAPQFGQLQFVETAGLTASISFYVANGDVVISNQKISGSVQVSSGGTATDGTVSTTDGTATLVAEANANRGQLVITNMSTEVAWIGGADVGNGSAYAGVPLAPSPDTTRPGGVYITDEQSAVYVRRDAATDVTVCFHEVTQ